MTQVDPKTLARSAQGLLNAAKAVVAATKQIQKLESDPEKTAFLVGAELAKLDKAIAVLADAGATTAEARRWRSEAAARNDAVKERVRSRLAAELAELLSERGLAVEGNLPELRCGVITIELLFDKGEARLFYGPRISVLGRSKLVAKELADAVAGQMEALAKAPLDGKAFLTDVRDAWRRVCRDEGKDPAMGPTVPVVAVLDALAWKRQGGRFRADPVRENFASYGRVQFSYDLHRLVERRLGDDELRLTVATREQTKSEAESLWVPRTARGEGTHFGGLAFRRAI